MTLQEIDIEFKVLTDLLTERISELHEVKGGMQARHAFILYRNILMELQGMVYKHINEIEGDIPKSRS
jgi:hypothetical protein